MDRVNIWRAPDGTLRIDHYVGSDEVPLNEDTLPAGGSIAEAVEQWAGWLAAKDFEAVFVLRAGDEDNEPVTLVYRLKNGKWETPDGEPLPDGPVVEL